MNHRPVCSKCELEFKPVKNEVEVLDFSDNGPYEITFADEWECTGCQFRIVVGFGDGPYARHYENLFDRAISMANERKSLRKNYGDARTRELLC